MSHGSDPLSTGFENRKNAYWCPECHGYVVTIDLDEGVTPMFLACRVLGEPKDPANTCTGRMHSMMYPEEPWPAEDGYGNPIPTVPTWEWYMPDAAELRKMGREGREHARKGGLSLRQRNA
jgi:hypothetical protein